MKKKERKTERKKENHSVDIRFQGSSTKIITGFPQNYSWINNRLSIKLSIPPISFVNCECMCNVCGTCITSVKVKSLKGGKKELFQKLQVFPAVR